MSKKFWTIAVALLFILGLAVAAEAQGRGNGNDPPGNGNPPGNSGNNGNGGGNGNQDGPPGQQGEKPGNGNQDGPPGQQGEKPGNGNQNNPPGNGNGNRGESARHRTPDGQTPAEESVCDVVKGGTPGLYGLCIAFCEAHDCEPVRLADDSLDLSMCKKNDWRLVEKYVEKMTEGDPPMPCLPEPNEEPQEVTCPCWGEKELAAFPAMDYSCENGFMYDVNDDGSCMQEINEVWDFYEYSDEEWVEYVMQASTDSGCFEGTYCYFAYDCNYDSCAEVDVWNMYLNISDAEFEVCKQQVQQLMQTYCP
jgi:hypothetical protein